MSKYIQRKGLIELHYGLYFPEVFSRYKIRFNWADFNLESQLKQPND